MKYVAAVSLLGCCYAQIFDQKPFLAGDVNVPRKISAASIKQKSSLSDSANPLNDDFAKYAQSVIDHFHVPAISVAVIANGTVYGQGYGTAVFPDLPAKAETLYYTGSTTKSFTAAALTLLMDDARNSSSAFDWDTRVVSLIRDDFVLQDEYITTHATLEDLGSHRTGFPRHDHSYGSKGFRTPRDTVRNMRNLPLTAGFREKFQYCNYMWATLGYIAEVVSGKSVGEILRTRLWDPLGMNGTFWTLEDAQSAVEDEGRELARGYTWHEASGKYYEDPYLDIGPLAAAGAMISNVLDYAEYLRMMLHRSGPLSSEAHTQLRRARSLQKVDVVHPYGGVISYTLGWDIKPYRGVSIRSHNGGLFGFGAFMAYVPELDYGVAMMANTAGTSNYAEEVIFYTLLDDLLGTPEDDRFGWTESFDKSLRRSDLKLNNTRQTEFGGPIPDPPIPASLPMEKYMGSYWSDGYKGLTLNISHPSAAIPGLNDEVKQVLSADWSDRVWPLYWQLEHVTGDFFVAWTVEIKGVEGNQLEMVGDGFAAEFKIGADGCPTELGLRVEEGMGEKKIWFRKV